MDVGDMLGAVGITKPELLTFLKERGVKTSAGAINAWARGLYSPPPVVVTELEILGRAVMGGDEAALSPQAPESVRRRCRTMAALR